MVNNLLDLQSLQIEIKEIWSVAHIVHWMMGEIDMLDVLFFDLDGGIHK